MLQAATSRHGAVAACVLANLMDYSDTTCAGSSGSSGGAARHRCGGHRTCEFEGLGGGTDNRALRVLLRELEQPRSPASPCEFPLHQLHQLCSGDVLGLPLSHSMFQCAPKPPASRDGRPQVTLLPAGFPLQPISCNRCKAVQFTTRAGRPAATGKDARVKLWKL